mgnify:CR=1 FL=1
MSLKSVYLQSETETIEFMEDNLTCGCLMPYLYKKWNGALGRFTAIRLCCLTKAIEKLTGEKFMEVSEFKPSWDWNCKETLENNQKRGCPPKYLLQRFKEKNIKVYHGDRLH